ncbi:hypothetical protein TNCV_3527521 [Trichonephila clavipes]|nr:hypothetical protein TNCV_3527521 [Trichonephila clavipes]
MWYGVLPLLYLLCQHWDGKLAVDGSGIVINNNPYVLNWRQTRLSRRPSPCLAFGMLVAPKIEGDVERSVFFNRCRSSGSRVQMDTQRTRIFLRRRNNERDRTIDQMYSC